MRPKACGGARRGVTFLPCGRPPDPMLVRRARLHRAAVGGATLVVAMLIGSVGPVMAQAPRPQSRILRTWPSRGVWHVFLVRIASADEAPGCMLLTGSALAPASMPPVPTPPVPMPPIPGRPPARSPPTTVSPPVAARQAGPLPATLWGFRLSGDELGLVINDRDPTITQASEITLSVDTEPVATVPVKERPPADGGLSTIFAVVSDAQVQGVVLGLLPLVDVVTLQAGSHTYAARFDADGETFRQLGSCREEARLLGIVRAAH